MKEEEENRILLSFFYKRKKEEHKAILVGFIGTLEEIRQRYKKKMQVLYDFERDNPQHDTHKGRNRDKIKGIH